MTNFAKQSSFALLTVFALFTGSSCKDHVTDPLPSCTGVEYGYDGAHGPEYWSELCVDFTPCGGKVQSPVNLANAVTDAALPAIPLTYGSSGTHIVNKGHTLQLNCDAGSSIVVNGETYKLLQFHTHTHSEHTLNGVSTPMEIHFVHKNEATGKLAVIGVFVEEGSENDVLKKFVDHLPTTTDAVYDDAASTFKITDLFPADQSYFTYSGSLTTPPCSEIVTWIVMEHPIHATATQIHDFEALEHENARPVQALEGRTIKYHKG